MREYCALWSLPSLKDTAVEAHCVGTDVYHSGERNQLRRLRVANDI